MIVVDLQAAQSVGSGNRGIGRYTRDLVRAIVTRHPDVIDRFAFNPDLPIDPRLLEFVPAERWLPVTAVAGLPIDVFHMTSPFESLPVDHLVPATSIGALVATCFDLIPLRFPGPYLDVDERPKYLTRLTALYRCAAIVTDSQSAADDCVDLLGIPRDRLTVIGGGTDESFVRPTDSLTERLDTLRESIGGLREGFVFVPTGMDWRKNIRGAMAAYAALPPALQRQHQLVIGCKVTHKQRRALLQMATDVGCIGDVLVTGFVGDDDLVRLYQSADTVLFTSFYEGFGLPVLEARRCGARVICSNVSSLPEVMPLEAATFNPYSTDDTAAHLERALTDAEFRAELDAAPDPGFTYELAADRTVAVYRRIAAEHRAAVVRRPLRLAVATLLPPSPSGVADHSGPLLDELAELADVTCFVADDTATAIAAQETFSPIRYPLRPLHLLPTLARGGAFDAVLYAMGNNPLHRPILDAFTEAPGYVLFHDVRLGGIYEPDERQAMAERHYPDATHPLPLYAAEVAQAARRCFVHSQHAADLLAADSGVAAVDVGPLPMKPAGAPGVEPITPPADDALWVISAGVADPIKQTHIFVAAAELLLERQPHVRAAVVGYGGERFVDDGSAVLATGRVDAGEYAAWVARAAVLVQLRAMSNGESSAAVADALANGAVSVVTDIGAMRELPDDVVVKVPRDVAPADLADVLEALVTDHDHRAGLRQAALAFAARNDMRAEAQRIVAAIAADRAG